MRIRSVTVEPEAMEAVVEFEEGEPLRTSGVPDAAGRLLTILPGLRGHKCANGEGRTFADELTDTELAHVIEHAALEVMALAGSPDTLRGETSWDFGRDGRGVFHVRLAYDDDRVAVGALRVAAAVVAWLLGRPTAPDVAGEVSRLRAIRHLARP